MAPGAQRPARSRALRASIDVGRRRRHGQAERPPAVGTCLVVCKGVSGFVGASVLTRCCLFSRVTFARGTSHVILRVDAIPLRRLGAADRAGRGAVGDAGLAQRQVFAGARHERLRPVEADDAELAVPFGVEPAPLLAGQDSLRT